MEPSSRERNGNGSAYNHPAPFSPRQLLPDFIRIGPGRAINLRNVESIEQAQDGGGWTITMRSGVWHRADEAGLDAFARYSEQWAALVESLRYSVQEDNDD